MHRKLSSINYGTFRTSAEEIEQKKPRHETMKQTNKQTNSQTIKANQQTNKQATQIKQRIGGLIHAAVHAQDDLGHITLCDNIMFNAFKRQLHNGGSVVRVRSWPYLTLVLSA